MSIWRKLNLKDQASVVVLDAPKEVLAVLGPPDKAELAESITGQATVPFAIAFVMDAADVSRALARLEQLLADDAVLWFAYPKKTSKRYVAAITRDTGWDALGKAGYEPVRQVAIDADWSALRFRKAERITKLTRRESMVLSDEGRRRVSNRTKDAS
jgi:hypothetical protein